MVLNRIGRVKPKTIRKLLDLATDHAYGEEAVAFSKQKLEEELEEPVARPEKKRKKERKLRSNDG
jgi:hypothetical protein